MNNRWLFTAATLLGLLAASGRVQAELLTALPPGTSTEITLPTVSPSAPAGTLLYSTTLNYNTPTVLAQVNVAVIRDSVTNDLDFIYQVKNIGSATQTDSISELSTTSFSFVNIQTTASGFGVGYSQTPITYTGPGPISDSFVASTASTSATNPNVSRPNAGPTGSDTIDFFRNTSSPLAPGDIGNILYLATNATSFNPTGGFVSVIDGTATSLPGPVPTPEPSTVVTAILGVVLAGGYRLRRRAR